MLGYQIEELQPLTYQTWLGLVNPADLLQAEQRLHDCLQGRTEHYQNEIRMRHRDGHWVWIHTCGQVVEWADGLPVLMSGTHTDISARKHNEEKSRLAASVFTHARESIMITNAAGEIVDVNATFTQSTGYSREEVLGRNPRLLKSGRHPDSFYEDLWRALAAQDYWCGEVWNRNRDGGVRASLLTISAVRDGTGEIGHYVSLFTDISAMKEQVAALEHSANYDPLTGLPNRLLLADRLQLAISQAERRASQLAVVFLDLDGFKAVNDAHGHDVGDELLILLAERMKAVLRESDTLARLGGDEFIAILGDLQQPPDCLPVLERLLVLVAEPVLVRGIELQVSVSIGVSLFPSHARSPQMLVRHADQAMYEAKQAGRNAYRFFASATNQTDPIGA
jgi:diguanylate cyclase (GGDEF)-like protein/PAS domain S-box-containing protein